MAFIEIIIALVLEQRYPQLAALRSREWVLNWRTWIRRFLFMVPGRYQAFLLLSLPPLFLLWIQTWLPWLFMLVLAVIILIHTLGPRDLQQQGESFVRAWRDGERSTSRHYAGEILGREVHRSTPDLARQIFNELVEQSQDRLFAVLFWFVVLGPAGALFYRLSQYLSTHIYPEEAWLQRLYTMVQLPTIFIVSLAYGLLGNLPGMVKGWKSLHEHTLESFRQRQLLAAQGALNLSEHLFAGLESGIADPIELLLNLIRRTILFMLFLIAVVGLIQLAVNLFILLPLR